MSSPRRHILCAESHDDTCSMIKLLLEHQGYEVQSAGTIDECLKLMAQEPFDLYLIGDRYPDGTGIELCQHLRSLRPLAPIMFFSTAAYEWNRQAGMSAGAQAYILKPIDIDVLADTVSRLISSHKSKTDSPGLPH